MRAIVASLVAATVLGCAGLSTSHGPRPLPPGEATLGLGAAVVVSSEETTVWPELSFRRGLSARTDAGITVTGLSAMVDGVISLWEADALVLSTGLGVGLRFTEPTVFAQPAVNFGTDRLFASARAFTRGRGMLPGVAAGGRIELGRCVGLLPSANVWFGDPLLVVWGAAILFPRGDC